RRARAVRVHVIEIARREAAERERLRDERGRCLSAFLGDRDVVGLGAHAPARKLRDRFAAARARRALAFEHEEGRALAEPGARTTPIERTATVDRDGAQRVEPCEGQSAEPVGSPGEHTFGAARADPRRTEENRVRSAGARAANGTRVAERTES